MTEDGLPSSPVDRADLYEIIREQIDHEVRALKEQIEYKDKIVDVRLTAMDKAVSLLEKFPTAIDVAIGSLKALLDQKVDDNMALFEEKFIGIGTRFNELNTRLTEGDRYKQVALDAALKAAQTLVDKQQENNKESIKKTEELFGKQIESLQETVDELKGLMRQQVGNAGGVSASFAWVIAGISMLAAVGLTVADFMHK